MSDARSDCRNAFGTALRLVAVAVILFLAAVVGCQPARDGSQPPPDVAVAGQGQVAPPIAARIRMIRVADDDGTRAADITPEQFEQWVDFANRVFHPAGIRFEFDRRDVGSLHSTPLNRATGFAGERWDEARHLGNRLASRHADRISVLVRHGPEQEPIGQGFSGGDIDFIIMPGFAATRVCGHQNVGLFAHEMGHFLGLGHTFSKEFATLTEAEAWLGQHGRDGFDGDGIADTPPDPFIRDDAVQCRALGTLVLDGERFPLPRDNVMSYYDAPAKVLTREQTARARATLSLRLRRPTNAEAVEPLEA
jgi:hypothetical protein